MITRIVRLSFQPEKTIDFKTIFFETQPHIQQFKGCIEVKLFQDTTHENVFYTVSKWNSEDDLNAYRQSDFFDVVWAKTKALFNDKPKAYSLNEMLGI